MKAIENLATWGLAEDELPALANVAVVRFFFAYPGYQAVLAYPPAERKNRISAQLRAKYQALKAALPPGPFEKVGPHYRPAGMRRLPVRQLPALLELAAVEGIWVEEIEGLAPRPPVAEPKCWSIKARFAVQVAHKTTGRQLVEERILLIAALDEEEARCKLRPTFATYAEPYLNSAGCLVRWQFEEFLAAYEVAAGPLAGLLSPEGLEIFSQTSRRRLTPERAWYPDLSAPPS